MREFIMLTEEISSALEPTVQKVIDNDDETSPERDENDNELITELGDLAEKLRSHTEDEDGEQSLGVEMGMQRAADMIDNLLRRYFGDQNFG